MTRYGLTSYVRMLFRSPLWAVALFLAPAACHKPSPTSHSAATVLSLTDALSSLTTDRMQSDFPTDGVGLKNGWNTLTGTKTSSICILGDTSKVSGRESRVDIWDAVDTDRFMHELGVSASAEVKAFLGTGSAKAEFSENQQIDDNHAYYAVRALTMNGASYVTPSANLEVNSIRLDKHYLNMAKKRLSRIFERMW